MDPAADVALVRSNVDSAVLAYRKGLLKLAKEGVLKGPARPRSQVEVLDPAAKRSKLARLLRHADVPITLAARDGTKMSDSEVDDLLDDLLALGIVEEDDRSP
jgi:hypothetical protein